MKFLRNYLPILLAALLSVSCGENKKEQAEDTAETVIEEVEETTEEVAETVVEGKLATIVGVAAANESFSTLVAAVKAAELVETLSSEGPFTVFAPTNDAFAKLSEDTLNSLLKPENKATLTGILTYHVVSGKFEAADVIEAINSNSGKFTVTTVLGESLDLSLNEGNVVITDITGGQSTVIIPDVEASNGVIHAVDSVILPE